MIFEVVIRLRANPNRIQSVHTGRKAWDAIIPRAARTSNITQDNDGKVRSNSQGRIGPNKPQKAMLGVRTRENQEP